MGPIELTVTPVEMCALMSAVAQTVGVKLR